VKYVIHCTIDKSTGEHEFSLVDYKTGKTLEINGERAVVCMDISFVKKALGDTDRLDDIEERLAACEAMLVP